MKNNPKRLKAAAVIAIALAMPLSLTGCSPAGGGETSKDAISIWMNGEPALQAKFEEALVGLTEKTGIKTKVVVYQNDQFKQNIANATGTSAMPDVFINWSGMGLLGDLYDSGSILPLDDYYAKYGWTERFNAAALTLDKVEGKYIGVPFVINEMAVVYKKASLKAAGINAVPTTYADLIKTNDALLAAGVTPWSFAGNKSWDLMRLTDSLIEMKCGAEKFDQLRNLEADWTKTPCATEGFAELTKWIEKGYLTKGFMALDPNARTQYEPIFEGKAAFTIDGNWSGPQFVTDGHKPDDFAFFPFPTDTERLSYFTSSLYINAGSKNKDDAAQVLDYLTDKAVVEAHPSILNGAISGTDGVAAPAQSTEYDLSWVKLAQRFKGVYLPSDQAFVPDLAQSFMRNQDRLALGQQDAKATVEALQRDIEVYKAQK